MHPFFVLFGILLQIFELFLFLVSLIGLCFRLFVFFSEYFFKFSLSLFLRLFSCLLLLRQSACSFLGSHLLFFYLIYFLDKFFCFRDDTVMVLGLRIRIGIPLPPDILERFFPFIL